MIVESWHAESNEERAFLALLDALVSASDKV